MCSSDLEPAVYVPPFVDSARVEPAVYVPPFVDSARVEPAVYVPPFVDSRSCVSFSWSCVSFLCVGEDLREVCCLVQRFFGGVRCEESLCF